MTQERLAVQALAGTATSGLALGSNASSAEIESIAGITTAPDGTAYVCDPLGNQIRAIPPSGPTFVAAGAGDGSAGFIGDNLTANAVRLDTPIGLVRDNLSGALIFCDSGNDRIRYFTVGGRIYTLAGGGLDSSDEVPHALHAALQQPFGLATDSMGNLYFTERGSGRVRLLSSADHLTTLATFATGTVGPLAVSADGSHLWVGVGDSVQMIASPSATPAQVFQAPGDVITGLAYDQVNSLYAEQTSATPFGASASVLTGLTLGADGKVLTGTTPEVLAGTGAGSANPLDYAVSTQPVADARTQLLAGGGYCSLYIDLYNAAAPSIQSGTLYMGNTLATSPGWAQLLTLVHS
ncbi:MAG TPA: hypothetical protein V6D47_17750 [Oscillatoriaceae cyanobacterium]